MWVGVRREAGACGCWLLLLERRLNSLDSLAFPSFSQNAIAVGKESNGRGSRMRNTEQIVTNEYPKKYIFL